ncbi:BTB/POZ domain-containing protein At1g63850-like [Curcuma longa]|uniref:BTB/POZ domain-containing protein At1g63850-like n=1 Tax=Curcuma longa TaxID=136217 RepID=UPI003D9E4509
MSVKGTMSLRKRQRLGFAGRLPLADGTLTDIGFDDPATADVVLRLELDDSLVDDLDPVSLDLHLRSVALRRSRYFDALLSERWNHPSVIGSGIRHRLNLKVLPSAGGGRSRGPFDVHVAVIRLLHSLDFSAAIGSVSDALEMLPVAMELLFDDCVRACVRFLEAVPWTEEEEEEVLNLVPLLQQEECEDLIARISPIVSEEGDGNCTSEEMLHKLIASAIRSHPNVATVNVKAFVAKLLSDYSSRDCVRRALDQAFLKSMEMVKDHLGKYASLDFRLSWGNDEREAMQRLNLHSSMMNAKNLHWLVERMIELRVADTAVAGWSEQASLAADLQKTFRDDAWKNIAPGLPSLIIRSTFRLANAVASGNSLAPRQVRMNLVSCWLPVLNVCRDIVFPMPTGQKSIIQDLEEAFLRIISTLPLSDSQDLLKQCLSFSTRNIDDCPHLILAFKTWFRRANRTVTKE